MRKEPFTVGSYVHVTKRGVRGMPIVQDNADRYRFLKLLYYFNDENLPVLTWESDIYNFDLKLFQRASHWRAREPIVLILAYALLDNHFHLLLKEIKEGGISRFMQKIGNSMTGHFNAKYGEQGTLFQSAYRARVVDDDNYFRYASVYIQVKNGFEMYPGGLDAAMQSFDDAYDLTARNPFTSLGVYAGMQAPIIVERELLGELFPTPAAYKAFAREAVEGRHEYLRE